MNECLPLSTTPNPRSCRGGYVAGASHDYILEETPVENVVAMFDAVSEYKLQPDRK